MKVGETRLPFSSKRDIFTVLFELGLNETVEYIKKKRYNVACVSSRKYIYL